jgi:CRISPR system Cascade subunit CasD
MAEFLCFQLVGPMASWGEIAIGEDRGSAPHPTRSAILGILASALGIRRHEEGRQRRLAASCRIAVVVCDPGELLRDYHTTQVPSSTLAKGWRLGTRRDEIDVIEWGRREKGTAGEAILSFRDYRCDGRWIVIVEPVVGAAYGLDEIRRALLKPRLTLFLGRKSCPPALPLEPQVVEAENLVDMLKGLRFTPVDRLTRAPQRRRRSAGTDLVGLFWEAGMHVGIAVAQTSERWDEPVSRGRWQFRPRREHHAVLPREDCPCT